MWVALEAIIVMINLTILVSIFLNVVERPRKKDNAQKMHILTSLWSAQHPNTGQNIQQKVVLGPQIFYK